MKRPVLSSVSCLYLPYCPTLSHISEHKLFALLAQISPLPITGANKLRSGTAALVIGPELDTPFEGCFEENFDVESKKEIQKKRGTKFEKKKM